MATRDTDRSRKKAGRYHHGDLRGALIDTAIELIAEHGIARFTLAEASRRLGVSVGAPYRHFADRESLLAAAATKAADALSAMLAAEAADVESPADRLAAAARAYVRFAADQRPLFETLFAAGLDKGRLPELVEATKPIERAFGEPAAAFAGDGKATEDLALAVVAIAHGHAALLVDGALGRGPDALEAAATRAAETTRAYLAGRAQ
ncbi:MAG: TetR family transcriptional regulator [Streptosporangiales bacterium]|nr:TetR family transcriptional regulator [Streptosporangiales bacterium]